MYIQLIASLQYDKLINTCMKCKYLVLLTQMLTKHFHLVKNKANNEKESRQKKPFKFKK